MEFVIDVVLSLAFAILLALLIVVPLWSAAWWLWNRLDGS